MLRNILGEGFTSKVYKGEDIDKPGTFVAVKIIRNKYLSDDELAK